jgi:hypothetical protein
LNEQFRRLTTKQASRRETIDSEISSNGKEARDVTGHIAPSNTAAATMESAGLVANGK